MNLQLLSEKLLRELDLIKSQNDKSLERADRSIIVCRNILSEFKKEVIKYGFKTVESEISFFKDTKQIALIPLIYFSEIHSFEIQFPKANKIEQQKYIKKKIKKLNRFFLYNLDFGQYVNSGAIHFDQAYYTRDFWDRYPVTTSKFYFQDPDFCTPRDMLLGKFKAYTSLVFYFEKKLHKVKNNSNESYNSQDSIDKIPWPFTNTDWVELVYALSNAGMANGNKISITKMSQLLRQTFDYKPKNIYKTFQEIKNRKNSRTLFLDQMTASLLSEMDKSEE